MNIAMSSSFVCENHVDMRRLCFVSLLPGISGSSESSITISDPPEVIAGTESTDKCVSGKSERVRESERVHTAELCG